MILGAPDPDLQVHVRGQSTPETAESYELLRADRRVGVVPSLGLPDIRGSRAGVATPKPVALAHA